MYTDSSSVSTGFIGRWADIYTGQVNCERWPVDRPRGWNAGLTDPGPMCEGGKGEVQVMIVEIRGQPDVGWLAATVVYNLQVPYDVHVKRY